MPEKYPLLELMPDVIQLDEDHPIVQIFLRMDTYYPQLPQTEYSEMLSLMIREIFYNLVIIARSGEAKEPLPDHPLIRRVVAYIQAHLTTLQDINELCRELFVSKSHLHHLFTEQMGISLKKYILTKRMMLAKTLLRSGEIPADVYAQCGFRNYTTFFRCYKQFFGYCPSEEQDKGCRRDLYS